MFEEVIFSLIKNTQFFERELNFWFVQGQFFLNI